MIVALWCAAGAAPAKTKALTQYHKLVALDRSSKGPGSSMGSVYINLGEQAQDTGRFSIAERNYRRAIAEFGESADPPDWRKVIALDDLGWLYVTWGRLNDGSRLLDEARAYAGENSGTRDPLVIRHLDTQAAFCVLLGRYTEAQHLWNQALQIGATYYRGDASQYDSILIHFGQASVRFGNYRTAQAMFERYLKIESQGSAPQSEEDAIVVGELAHLFTAEHKYSSAEPLFENSLAIMQKLPEEAPLSSSLLFSYYGDYFMAQGKWGDAAQRYRRALTLQKKVLGETRVTAASMVLLAKALRRLHRKHEAGQLTAEAGKIRAAQPDLAYAQDTVDVQSLRAH
ncbi:MAG TPA: tetratricopeptide repeat protein [Bryobacteraceae bacterium]|nr:tetratricopeptide repeat protein [Bryobacteraceae bacterium]